MKPVEVEVHIKPGIAGLVYAWECPLCDVAAYHWEGRGLKQFYNDNPVHHLVEDHNVPIFNVEIEFVQELSDSGEEANEPKDLPFSARKVRSLEEAERDARKHGAGYLVVEHRFGKYRYTKLDARDVAISERN